MSLSLFRKKSYVGVDLGTAAIKVVQIDRTPTGWKVSRAIQAKTPEDSIKDGVVSDSVAVADTVRHLVRSAKFTATNAVVGVAGPSVIVRTVHVPQMSEAMLRKSIRYEAGRYVPSNVDDSFIEFEIIGPAAEGQMNVLVVAAPRDLVRSRVQAVEEAGLEVDLVDVEAFAMYRAIVESDEARGYQDETVALLDIGSGATQVSVVNHGVFAMTRTIPQAGRMLTEALKNQFKLSDEDAESGKAQLNLEDLLTGTGPVENPPLRVLQPHVDELVREVRRSLNYYQSQHSDSGPAGQVGRIIVAGGAAALPGLAAYMTSRLGIPTETVGVLDNPRFSYAGHDELGHGLGLSVASGLAMRAFAKAA